MPTKIGGEYQHVLDELVTDPSTFIQVLHQERKDFTRQARMLPGMGSTLEALVQRSAGLTSGALIGVGKTITSFNEGMRSHLITSQICEFRLALRDVIDLGHSVHVRSRVFQEHGLKVVRNAS